MEVCARGGLQYCSISARRDAFNKWACDERRCVRAKAAARTQSYLVSEEPFATLEVGGEVNRWDSIEQLDFNLEIVYY